MADSNADGFWDRELSGLSQSERKQAQDAYDRGALRGGTRQMAPGAGPIADIANCPRLETPRQRAARADRRAADREAGG
jgi:hypothetical protein